MLKKFELALFFKLWSSWAKYQQSFLHSGSVCNWFSALWRKTVLRSQAIYFHRWVKNFGSIGPGEGPCVQPPTGAADSANPTSVWPWRTWTITPRCFPLTTIMPVSMRTRPPRLCWPEFKQWIRMLVSQPPRWGASLSVRFTHSGATCPLAPSAHLGSSFPSGQVQFRLFGWCTSHMWKKSARHLPTFL